MLETFKTDAKYGMRYAVFRSYVISVVLFHSIFQFIIIFMEIMNIKNNEYIIYERRRGEVW